MKVFLQLFILYSLFCVVSLAGSGDGVINSSTEESIPVELKLKGVNSTELFILRKDGRTYLPVTELFKFLRIKVDISADHRNLQGFFLSRDSSYSIDFDSKTALFQNRRISLSEDMFILSTQDIYLESEFLNEMFGIKSDYNPRRLVVTLTSVRELPIVTATKRQKNRERMFQFQEVPPVAQRLERSPFLFGGARLDYRFTTVVGQARKPQNSYRVSLGTHIIGGDLQATVNGVFSKKINENNVNAFIRWPFFDGDAIRQIILGDIPPEIDPLFIGTLRGLEITNRPAPRRLSIASELFTIDAPGAEEVELYQSGRLHSYFPGSSDGIYKFQLAIPYGNSDIEFRSYDEWGGLEIQRYRFNVSQLMVPPGEFQYSLKGGQLRRFQKEFYTKAKVDYGASSSLTVGLDAQYIDLKNDGQHFYPAITGEAALRVTPGILGEFAFSPLLASKFLLNGSFPSQAYITFSQIWYKLNSPLNIGRAIEQTNFAVNIPFYYYNYGLVFNVQAEQGIFESLRRRNINPRIELYRQGYRFGLSTNIGRTTFSNNQNNDFWTTRASASIRLPYSIIFSGALQYDHKAKKVQDVMATVSRAFGTKLLVIASYNRSFLPSFVTAYIQVAYDFPFLHVELRGIRSDGHYEYNQVLTGSVLTSSTFTDFFFDNRVRLGRSVVHFRPFLDQNSNGVLDAGEHYMPQAQVKTFGPQLIGVGIKTKQGYLIPNAEAYQEYLGYIPKQSFEDPHWIPQYSAVSLMTEPNILRIADMPIVVGGIVNGKISQSQAGAASIPTEGVTVKISDGTFTRTTRSFSTGEFSFIGIPPGHYVISISRDELLGAGLRPVQSEISIDVRSRPEGDMIDNVNFEVVER